MEDWSSEAARKFKAEDDLAQRKIDRAAQEKSILESQGMALWNELRQWIQQESRAFNEKMGREVLVAPVTDNHKLTVFAKTATGQRELNLHFESSSHTISYTYPHRDGKLVMKVSPENNVGFQAPGANVFEAVPVIGGRLLNLLLKN